LVHDKKNFHSFEIGPNLCRLRKFVNGEATILKTCNAKLEFTRVWYDIDIKMHIPGIRIMFGEDGNMNVVINHNEEIGAVGGSVGMGTWRMPISFSKI
jgi:hypothetical protein